MEMKYSHSKRGKWCAARGWGPGIYRPGVVVCSLHFGSACCTVSDKLIQSATGGSKSGSTDGKGSTPMWESLNDSSCQSSTSRCLCPGWPEKTKIAEEWIEVQSQKGNLLSATGHKTSPQRSLVGMVSCCETLNWGNAASLDTISSSCVHSLLLLLKDIIECIGRATML